MLNMFILCPPLCFAFFEHHLIVRALWKFRTFLSFFAFFFVFVPFLSSLCVSLCLSVSLSLSLSLFFILFYLFVYFFEGDGVRWCLRNRFLLTVICCPIYHRLEVRPEVDISRARSVSDVFTDDRPTTSDILGNNSLVSKILFRF